MLVGACSFLKVYLFPTDQRIILQIHVFLLAQAIGGKDQDDAENPSKSSEKYQGKFLPPNYATIHQFFKSAYMNALGLSGVGTCLDLHASFLIYC